MRKLICTLSLERRVSERERSDATYVGPGIRSVCDYACLRACKRARHAGELSMVAVRVASLRLSSAYDSRAIGDDRDERENGGDVRDEERRESATTLAVDAVLGDRVRRVLHRGISRERRAPVRVRERDDRGLRPAAARSLRPHALHDPDTAVVVPATRGLRARRGGRP